MARGWTYLHCSENTPKKFTSHKLVFFTNLGVLQTFSTNQAAANKQGIHGLMESGLKCTLNMVLHVNTMCAFGMERKYPKLPYFDSVTSCADCKFTHNSNWVELACPSIKVQYGMSIIEGAHLDPTFCCLHLLLKRAKDFSPSFCNWLNISYASFGEKKLKFATPSSRSLA